MEQPLPKPTWAMSIKTKTVDTVEARFHSQHLSYETFQEAVPGSILHIRVENPSGSVGASKGETWYSHVMGTKSCYQEGTRAVSTDIRDLKNISLNEKNAGYSTIPMMWYYLFEMPPSILCGG